MTNASPHITLINCLLAGNDILEIAGALKLPGNPKSWRNEVVAMGNEPQFLKCLIEDLPPAGKATSTKGWHEWIRLRARTKDKLVFLRRLVRGVAAIRDGLDAMKIRHAPEQETTP